MVVRRVSDELTKKGHSCTVLTDTPGNRNTDAGLNCPVVRVPGSPSYFVGLNLHILSYLYRVRASEYDVVSIHGYHTLMSLGCACVCVAKKIPYVFSSYYHGKGHSALTNAFFKAYGILGKRIIDRSEKTICISNYERDILVSDLNVSPARLEVIAQGVGSINTGKKVRKDGSIRLLYVGYLRKYKGIEYILQAVRVLKSRYHANIGLDVIGTGEDGEYLKNVARTLGISAEVNWLSPVPENELYQRYAEADMLLLLSSAESYGLVVSEALSSGTPCIVANTSALSEFTCEPGCYGVAYPPDPQELAELILDIRGKDVKVGPFSKKIRTWDEIVEDYEIVYGKAAGRKQNVLVSDDKRLAGQASR